MTDRPGIAPEAQAALDRAQARLDAGDLTAALNDCEAALQLAPQWAEAHNLRGIVLDEMGRTGEAIASYQETVRLDPNLPNAAENLAELRREHSLHAPKWMRVAGALTPLVVLAVVLLIIRSLEAERGPDWQLTLNEYIAQRAQSHEVLTVQKVVTARNPASFISAMGLAVPGGPLWDSVQPVFPPSAVQCVLLEQSGAAQGEAGLSVVYLAYHSNSLYRVGWRVYEARQSPFTPQLLADLQAIGCELQ
jgi:tetratricopeptide (TPR) repeat protein